ncbi:MAG: hypothetical protein PHH60_05715 [Candidatus Margulisbacteria bacterium]|nr:hypothetical protein [Candidatus Margulisiibacteriota bacterium]
MQSYGIPHLKKFPSALINFRLSPTTNGYFNNPRGCGQVLRATVHGERKSFRTLDYVSLKEEGIAALAHQLERREKAFRPIVPDETALPRSDRPWFTWEPNLEGRPTLISPVFTEHDQVHSWLTSYKYYNRASFVLIINVDAHRDRGYTNRPDTVNYTNWAQVVEDEHLGRVIHFPSYYDDRSGLVKGTNWNTPAFRLATADAVSKIKTEHGNSLEVWVTIDYDYFSILAVELRGQKLVWLPGYHLDPAAVRSELKALTDFFTELNLPISQVIPCSSPAYLGAAEYGKESYIAEVTELIQQAF